MKQIELQIDRPQRRRTRSTAEAMDVLETHRRRLIDYARYVAAAICREQGTVHSREVRAALAEAGLLGHGDKEFWLGAVFRVGFEWHGDWFVYSDEERNIHERRVKVWRVSQGIWFKCPDGLPEYRPREAA